MLEEIRSQFKVKKLFQRLVAGSNVLQTKVDLLTRMILNSVSFIYDLIQSGDILF